MKPYNILIATPFYGVGISPFTEKSIRQVLKSINSAHRVVTSSLLPQARNSFVQDYPGCEETFQTPLTRRGFTHILWVDWDISFDISDVFKLLSHDLDVVSAVYKVKDSNDYCAGYYEQGIPCKVDINNSVNKNQGLKEVDWCGNGFRLDKAEVYDKMRFPYFEMKKYAYHINNTSHTNICGEDIGFCHNANLAGYKIMVDTDIEVNHHPFNISFQPIMPDDFKE